MTHNPQGIRSMPESRIATSLFVVFFCVYMLSLPVFSERFQSPLIFGADDMLDAYKGGTGRNLTAKHPLFFVVTLLYRFATRLFSWAGPDLAQNLSMVFPMALLGATAVCVAYRVFSHNCTRPGRAVAFTVLYGISATTWLFASFPETYVLTALCTNLVLWSVLRIATRPRPSDVNRTALLNALACFATPQQIFLAFIPLVRWLRESRLSRSFVQLALRYAVVFSAAFLIPYEVYLKITGYGWRFGPVYLRAYGHMRNLIDARRGAVVALNFLLFSVVAPAVGPRYFTDPSLSIFRVLPLTWLFTAALFLIFCATSIRGLNTLPAKKTAIPMLMFLAVYMLFFQYFNPAEAYLYTLPPLLPLLLVLQAGFCSKSDRFRQVGLWVLIAAIGVNNLYFRLYLQSIKLR